MGRIKITDNEQTITNDVFIDLAYQEEISVAKHILQIDPDYIKLLGFIPTRIRKQINSDIDVRLEDATCTEGISIENGQQCLYIKHNGAIHKGTSTHNIKGTTDMEVVMLSKEMNLNADEWREALVKQKRYQVGYRWVVEGQKNKKEKYVLHKDYIFNVAFRNHYKKPEVEIQLNKEFEDGYNYRPSLNGFVAIGHITVSNPNAFKATPGLHGILSIYLEGEEGATQDVYLCRQSTNDYVQDTDIQGLESGREFQYGLFLDTNRLGNPAAEKATFRIKATFHYVPSYLKLEEEKNTATIDKEFFIIKDKVHSELRCFFRDGTTDAFSPLPLVSEYDISLRPINYQPGLNAAPVSILRLQNNAISNVNGQDAKIVISSFETRVILHENCPKIEMRDGYETENCFTIRNSNGDTSSSVLNLYNAPNSYVDYEMRFHPERIGRIETRDKTKRSFTVDINVRISYYEDPDGNPDNRNTTQEIVYRFIHTINIRPQDKWLCIDYGTSAIAACYGTNILNLNKQKRRVFEGGGYNDSSYSQDILENGLPFISSDIILQQGGSFGATDTTKPYSKLAICLSPTSKLQIRNYTQLLPCLKSLVGYSELPNLYSYKDYKYLNAQGQQTAVAIFEEDEDRDEVKIKSCSELGKIDRLFSEVYRILFNYFIKPAMPKEAINKIVLTIPNTYTPKHKSILNSIVKDNFPDIYEEYIRFVSESDAVACYYLHNWHALNHQMNARQKEQLKKEELVLVYDMGAGTLDLTYFHKKQENGATPHTTVKILGKIGINKAGNYLDYILAEVVSKNEKNSDTLRNCVKLDQSVLGAERDLTNYYKNYIKNVVKVKLNQPEYADNVKIGNTRTTTNVKVDINDVRNNRLYKQFKKEVTSELLDIFFEGLGYDASQHPKVDTVIFSGRSSRLKEIRDSFQEALEKWGVSNCNIVQLGPDQEDDTTDYSDIIYTAEGNNRSKSSSILSSYPNTPQKAENSLLGGFNKNEVKQPGNTRQAESAGNRVAESVQSSNAAPTSKVSSKEAPVKEDKLKTVVVEGAMVYASIFSRKDSIIQFNAEDKLFASYGILYYAEGLWKYEEILKRGTQRIADASQDNIIFEGEKEHINLGSTDRIHFVQTYMSQQMTEREWRNKSEYLSIIQSVGLDVFDNKHDMTISVSITKDNNVKFAINQYILPEVPATIDSLDNSAYKKSVWPVVFNINQKETF